MTITKTVLATLLVAAALVPGLASAQTQNRAKNQSRSIKCGTNGNNANNWSVNRREANQRGRIVKGYRDDSLTNREAGRLAAEQARIRAFEARNRKDGKGYTTWERIQTQRRLNEASRNIYRFRHNDRK